MRWAGAAAAAAAACLLAACGGSDIPVIEELPPNAEADDPFESAVTERIRGTVVSQQTVHGDPETGVDGSEVVWEEVVVTIAPSGREGTIELVVPSGYVPYPPPDTGGDPLDLPPGEWVFLVRETPDGRYQCAPGVCIVEAE